MVNHDIDVSPESLWDAGNRIGEIADSFQRPISQMQNVADSFASLRVHAFRESLAPELGAIDLQELGKTFTDLAEEISKNSQMAMERASEHADAVKNWAKNYAESEGEIEDLMSFIDGHQQVDEANLKSELLSKRSKV